MMEPILAALKPMGGVRLGSRQLNLLELLLDCTVNCAVLLDTKSNVIHSNESFARAVRRAAPSLRGVRGLDLFDGPVERIFAQVVRTGTAMSEHGRLFASTEDVEDTIGGRTWTMVPVRDEEGHVDLVILALDTDATGQQSNESAQLHLATAQIARLARQLVDSPELERKKMARALHDELGQSLTSIKLALEAGMAATRGSTHDRLCEALAVTRDIMTSVTQVAQALRPAVLDDLGLLPALLSLIDRHRMLTGLTTSITHKGLDTRLSQRVETVVYRTVQEALTNISRHAGVCEAQVTLLRTTSALTIRIDDLGAGFEAEEAIVYGAGRGLQGMIQRVEALGGIFSIDSEPGRGSTICVELPLVPVAVGSGEGNR